MNPIIVKCFIDIFGADRKHLALSRILLAALFSLFATTLSAPAIDKHPPRLREAALTPHDELYSVHMHPNGLGWAVGKFGIILHTRDGGINWIQQNSGTREPLTSVSFADTGIPDNAGSTARELSGVMFADLQRDYHSNYFPQPRIADIDLRVNA